MLSCRPQFPCAPVLLLKYAPSFLPLSLSLPLVGFSSPGALSVPHRSTDLYVCVCRDVVVAQPQESGAVVLIVYPMEARVLPAHSMGSHAALCAKADPLPPSLPALSQGGNSSEAGGRIRWTSWRHDVVGF